MNKNCVTEKTFPLDRESEVAIVQGKMCQSLETKYDGDFSKWDQALKKAKAMYELHLDAVNGLISQIERLLAPRGNTTATKRRVKGVG